MAASNAMNHEARRSCKHMLFAEPQEASDPHMQRATRMWHVAWRAPRTSGRAPDPSARRRYRYFSTVKAPNNQIEVEIARDRV